VLKLDFSDQVHAGFKLRRSGFETVLQRTKLKTSTYTFEIPRAAVASTP